jgi:hypothetical protein
VASIVTRRWIAGSARASLIVPRTENTMRAAEPGRRVFTAVMAARSEPGPASRSVRTTWVRAAVAGPAESAPPAGADAAAAVPAMLAAAARAAHPATAIRASRVTPYRENRSCRKLPHLPPATIISCPHDPSSAQVSV